MTGELSVALVHTARVLQMLVFVVLVRKHLPAPFALETLTSIWGKRRNQHVKYGGETTKNPIKARIGLDPDPQRDGPRCCPVWGLSG